MTVVASREAAFQVGSANSFIGDGIRFAAVPLLAAAAGADASAVSLLFVAGTAPWLLIAPFSGALVDRVSRTGVLIGADAVRLLLSLVLLAAVVADLPPLVAVLVVLSFGFGVVETLYDVAGIALIPSLVPREGSLERVNARYAANQTLGRELGGPVAGALLHGWWWAAPYVAGVALYSTAVLLLGRLRGLLPAATPPAAGGPAASGTGWWRQVLDGARFLRRSRVLVVLATVAGTGNLSLLAAQATLVLFVVDELDGSGLGYSLVVAGPAVGAVLGSWLVTKLRRWLRPASTLLVAMAGSAMAFGWAAAAQRVWSVVAAFVLLGVCFMCWNVVSLTTRQQIVPDELRGRVESVYRALSWGALPLGAGAGGVIAEQAGLRAPLIMAAGLCVAASAVLVVGLRGITELAPDHAAGPDAAGAR